MNSSNNIPKERRTRNKDTLGVLDDDGFFRTPNGSFWDCDGEYFNRYGYDIHGGYYVNVLDYVPGPQWIEELGCYPEDKEKYLNVNEGLKDDDVMFDEEEGDPELMMKEGEEDVGIEDYDKLGLSKEQLRECFEKCGIDYKEEDDDNDRDKKKGRKHKKKGKKGKKESDDDDEWEECSDDE